MIKKFKLKKKAIHRVLYDKQKFNKEASSKRLVIDTGEIKEEGEECSIDARSPLIGQRRDVSARGFSKPIKK